MAKDLMAPNPDVLWGASNKAAPSGNSEEVNARFEAESLSASKEALERLRGKFGRKVLAVREFKNEIRVEIAPDSLAGVLEFLRDEPSLGFTFLSQVAGAEWYKNEQTPQRFLYLTYDLYSFDLKARISIYVVLPKDAPCVKSVAHLFSTAEWHEREVYDLFGVNFDGHPDLRRILLPPHYDGHPLLKEYPARGKTLWNLNKNVIPADLDEILDGFGG